MTQLQLDQIPPAPPAPQFRPSTEHLAALIANEYGVSVDTAKDWIVRAYFDLEVRNRPPRGSEYWRKVNIKRGRSRG